MIIIDDDGVMHDVIPKKQIDKMIEEIENYGELGDVGFTRTLISKDTVLEIIRKYTDKEGI